MANEFVAKNGLISQNNSTVSGSLTVTQGITGSFTGSLTGTASTASYVNILNQNVIVTGSLTLYTGSGAGNSLIFVKNSSNSSTEIGPGVIQLNAGGYNYQLQGSGFDGSSTINIPGGLNATMPVTVNNEGADPYGNIALTTIPTASFITASNVVGTVTSASYALTASYLMGGTMGANITASFTNQTTWTFNHALNNQGVIIQTFDSSWNQIIPQNIALTNTNTATITFTSARSGYAIASIGGTTSIVNAVNSISASFASTASFVNTLNQNVIITGSVAIGTGSIGNGENNLLLGPAPAGGTGEGGQIALLAAGGSYTSSSFIDNWQNQFRILRGPGATSNAGLMYMDLQSGNTQFVGAVTASAYSGLPNSWLHALRTSSQTIGSGTWASRDIIFDQVASINFTYNSSTGIATLRANKTYRLTARVAWSAAGIYTLKFRVYNQTTSAFTGPTVEMIQSPNSTFNVSDNTLEHILAVGSSDIDISIRTTSDTNAQTGEFIRGDLNTQLIIQQIA